MAEVIKLFDISLYPRSETEIARDKLTEDLGGMMLETGLGPIEGRINPRRLKIANNKVVDPLDNRDVLLSTNNKTELAKIERESARRFYGLLRTDRDSLVIAVSPPGGISKYREGRVNVGLNIGLNIIHVYGIPTKFSPEQCLSWAIRLTEFSDFSLKTVQPDDLRQVAIPINVPRGMNPWVFLEEFAPLDSSAWSEIKTGKPWLNKRRAIADSKLVAAETMPHLQNASTEYDFILVGALAERRMQNLGWRFGNGGCPGLLNSQLLMMFPRNSLFVHDVFGNFREIYYTFPCPACGQPIPSGRGIEVCPHCKAKKSDYRVCV